MKNSDEVNRLTDRRPQECVHWNHFLCNKGHIYKTRVGSNPHLSEFTGFCDHCHNKADCPDFTPKTEKDGNA